MKTLKEAAETIGIRPEALRRRIVAGVVPATRHPVRGHLLNDDAIAQAVAIFTAQRTTPAKRRRGINPVPVLPEKMASHVTPHPQEASFVAQIKGLERLVAAHQAQVDDLQTRLTAAEATIRACALMAPAAAMSR